MSIHATAPDRATAIGRPVWAEVSSSTLVTNYQTLLRQAGNADLLPVVKANAYGHGLEPCARLLADAGARWLGVTCVEEGVALRTAGVACGVLVMCGVQTAGAGRLETKSVVEHGLTPVVWELAHLESLAEAARDLRRVLQTRPVSIHLEVDTGMGRQGIGWRQHERLSEFAARLQALPEVRLTGVMTHYASPEHPEWASNALQTDRFAAVLERLGELGLQPELVHAGNSETLFDPVILARLRQLAAKHGARLMLRPGIALYGGGRDASERGLTPVLAWKTRILSLRTLEPGDTVGYGSTFTAARPTRLALVAVGYADGFARQLSNRGSMLLRGVRVPVVGRISMDLSTIDVTDVPDAGQEICAGEEVVILGRSGNEQITAEEIAALTGTISYEVLCGIAARVPRCGVI